MKIYTAGTSFISPPIVAALGLPGHVRQGRLLVVAHTKAEAFGLLHARHLGPDSIRDPEFRVAMGNDVDALIVAGLDREAAVFVVQSVHSVGPVVRVAADGTPTVVGRIEDTGTASSPVRFVAEGGAVVLPEPEPAEPAEGAQPAGQAPDPEVFAAACQANAERVAALNVELAAARAQRQELARQAVQHDLVEGAADAFAVTPGRVYQLSDEHLVAEVRQQRQRAANQGKRFRSTTGAS